MSAGLTIRGLANSEFKVLVPATGTCANAYPFHENLSSARLHFPGSNPQEVSFCQQSRRFNGLICASVAVCAQHQLGGVVGIILGMLLETLLFIIRSA